MSLTAPSATTLAIIRRRVSAERHHLLLASARLDALALHPVDHWAIAVDIEDEMQAELDWDKIENWQSVDDIQATVNAALGQPRPVEASS